MNDAAFTWYENCYCYCCLRPSLYFYPPQQQRHRQMRRGCSNQSLLQEERDSDDGDLTSPLLLQCAGEVEHMF